MISPETVYNEARTLAKKKVVLPLPDGTVSQPKIVPAYIAPQLRLGRIRKSVGRGMLAAYCQQKTVAEL